MSHRKPINDALDRLAAAERDFLGKEFLAPALPGGAIHVRLAGVICRLTIQPPDFAGFGIFRPTSHTQAQLLRPARLSERQRYLELFPRVRLILAARREDAWWALPAHRGDQRFRIDGLVPVCLVEEGQLFEVIESRFDGAHFWYACPDGRHDPAAAAYLRRALADEIAPDVLQRPGLTAEEREAYVVAFQETEKARRLREEQRLRDALAHAGAALQEVRERDDVYTVSYEVDGRRHVSVVSKKDLSVQVAGICLSGQDEAFDLTSLVGVLREGQGGVVRVGRDNQGMDEEDYWRVHPRQPRP